MIFLCGLYNVWSLRTNESILIQSIPIRYDIPNAISNVLILRLLAGILIDWHYSIVSRIPLMTWPVITDILLFWWLFSVNLDDCLTLKPYSRYYLGNIDMLLRENDSVFVLKMTTIDTILLLSTIRVTWLTNIIILSGWPANGNEENISNVNQ